MFSLIKADSYQVSQSQRLNNKLQEQNRNVQEQKEEIQLTVVHQGTQQRTRQHQITCFQQIALQSQKLFMLNLEALSNIPCADIIQFSRKPLTNLKYALNAPHQNLDGEAEKELYPSGHTLYKQPDTILDIHIPVCIFLYCEK